jgi:hypothetical protein
MTAEQLDDLKQSFSDIGNVEFNINSINAVFPANGNEAAEQIIKMIPEKISGVQSIEVICGVFPAHVALSLVRMRDNKVDYFGPAFNVLIPVSVPAPAVEGEVRGGGFIHHHWEFH